MYASQRHLELLGSSSTNMLLTLVSLLACRAQQGMTTKFRLPTTVMLLDFHHLFADEEIKKRLEILSNWTTLLPHQRVSCTLSNQNTRSNRSVGLPSTRRRCPCHLVGVLCTRTISSFFFRYKTAETVITRHRDLRQCWSAVKLTPRAMSCKIKPQCACWSLHVRGCVPTILIIQVLHRDSPNRFLKQRIIVL